MDIWTLIGVIVGVVSAIAAVVQIIEFFQNRRQQKQLKSIDKQTTTTTSSLLTNTDVKNETTNLSQKFVVLHNLPPRDEFIGRKAEIEQVHQELLSRSHLICIEGIGGVGKTALALEIAHECLSASQGNDQQNQIATFNGLVWITSKDHELSLDDLLDEVAQTLNHIVVMKQPLKEKQRSITQILQKTPSLLIVDNYEAITDNTIYDFLSKISEPSKALITTRVQKFGQARVVRLEGLSEVEALVLIRSHGDSLGLEEIAQASRATLMKLYQPTKGHPLVIKWALGQIKQEGQTLSLTLERLKKAEGSIFDQLFLISWNLLSQDARRVLRIMPIFTTDAFKQSVAVTSRLFGKDFDTAIGQLNEMSLINRIAPQGESEPRFSIHPLTQSFALSKLQIESQVAYYAKKDLAIFYEEYTRKYGGLWNLPGFKILKPDVANIISIIRWCWQEQLIETGINIFDNIRYFVINYGQWNTALELAQGAIKLLPFEISNPPKKLAEWHTKTVLFKLWPIAWILRFRGNYDIVKIEITKVLELFKYVGDEHNVAYAKRHLSLVLQKVNKLDDAEVLLQEALAYSESTQDEYRIMLLQSDLADLALKRGDFRTAKQLSNKVFDISTQIIDSQGEQAYQKLQSISIFYRVLGSISKKERDFKQARKMCEEALKFTEKLEYRDGIAEVSLELAQIDAETGNYQSARKRYERAYEIYKALGMDQKILEIESVLQKLEDDNVDK